MIKKIETIVTKFFFSLKIMFLVIFLLWIIGSVGSAKVVELEFALGYIKHIVGFISSFFCVYIYTVYKINLDIHAITEYKLSESIE